jgi:tRNA nucleotidyltransferase/poly(A) polymerase
VGDPLSLDYSSFLEQLRQIIPPETKAYLVGGAVRDRLLGLPVHDFDLVLAGDALQLARDVANRLGGAYYPLDIERETGRVVISLPAGKHQFIDLARMRDADIESDLRGRDFTVNAMASDIHHPSSLIDPLNGAADLRAQRLRTCSSTSIQDDPVRVLRAIRLANIYELRIEPATLREIRLNVPYIQRVSIERLRDELFRILDGPRPAVALRLIEQLDVLPHLLPELSALKGLFQPAPHISDVWTHTLDVLAKLELILKVLGVEHDPDYAANLAMGLVSIRLGRYRQQLYDHLNGSPNPNRSLRSLLFLAALYHDAAKPLTSSKDNQEKIHFYRHEEIGAELIQRRAGALRLSNEEAERLAVILRHHMRPLWLSQASQLPSKRAIYRFFRDTEQAGVDICLLSLADMLGIYGSSLPQDIWSHHLDVVRVLLEAWWEHPNENISPSPLIRGKILIEEFGLAPGPIIGEILEAVREAQAAGEVQDLDQARNLIRSIIDLTSSA